ncbi:MAG: ArsR family transcriptional regulator [Candidatus Hodarchaeota archaeon]
MRDKMGVVEIAFILNGKNRRQIFKLLLEGNRSISELSRSTGIPISNICRVIRDFEKYAIVKNFTPDRKRGKLYA